MLGMENDTKMASAGEKEEVKKGRYELGYLLLPSIAEAALAETLEKIKGVVKNAGGTVVFSNPPVSISLAYPMYRNEGGKNTEFTMAYFGFIHFDIQSRDIAQVKNEIEKMPAILRSLFISDPHEPIQAPILPAEALPLSSSDKPEEKETKKDAKLLLDDAALDRELADMLTS